MTTVKQGNGEGANDIAANDELAQAVHLAIAAIRAKTIKAQAELVTYLTGAENELTDLVNDIRRARSAHATTQSEFQRPSGEAEPRITVNPGFKVTGNSAGVHRD